MAAQANSDNYLAIDFGSNHITVAVGGAMGALHSTAKAPLNYFTPVDGPASGLEFDPESVMNLIVETSQEVISNSGIGPENISGIGVSSQRQGLVLLNLEGQPLYGGPNIDRRATVEGADIDSNALVNVWELTGHGPGSVTAWARLKWFAENKPDVYERTRTACSIADWIVLELTGELLLEETLAVEAGMGLISTGEPASALAAAFNLGDIQLPQSCAAGTVVGNLKQRFSKQLGVSSKTPVVACGSDAQTALLGLGVQLPNAIGILSGWSTTCLRVTERPVFDDTRALWTGRHVINNRWVMDGNAGETGSTYQWLLSLLYGSLDNEEVMKAIDEPLGNIEPGSNAVTSFLGPSLVHTSHQSERTGGFLFPIPATANPPDRFDIARSALDSFAFAIRYNIERLNSFRGPALNISVGGGMTRTNSFRNILANVLGCDIGIGNSGNSVSPGALSMTAAGTGKGPSVAELAANRSSELVTYEPDETSTHVYDELYSEWRHKERLLDNLEL